MQNDLNRNFFGLGISRLLESIFLAVTLALLVGCGGGGGGGNGLGGGATGGSTDGSTSGGSTPTPTVTLALTDPTTGSAVTSISTNNNALATATVKDASGTVVPGAIVVFSTDPVFGTFTGDANTALTDASGKASVTLTTSNTTGGAATLTASSTVAGAAVTGSINYGIGAPTLSLSAISVPAGTLSAYGTASVSVNVLNNGVLYTTPLTVNFSSTCATSGKATLTASVTTVNGTANATYLDKGCNNANPGDTITATLLNTVTATASLKVGAPSLGSIQYVSTVTNPATTPPMITLKGTGGAGRSETAQVTFKVVDSAGNPVGNTLVNFSLNTCVGGLTLSGATGACTPNATISSATSDPITGNVVTNVISGTSSTAVRVTASTGSLSTQSDQLLLSTGIPAQDTFSLSSTIHNLEAWNFDGVTATITARLADHFHNPVPDGTAVSFTTEGGSVLSGCTTLGGSCSVVWTSQNPRPDNGRTTILAHAIGEEAFVDSANGNGTADSGELFDINGRSTDMPEAWVDYNEDGARNANEAYFDFNSNGSYDVADGKYNGVLCTTPGAGICSAQKSIHVRDSQVIVFSSSQANILINGGSTIELPTSCNQTPVTFIVTVVDINGNAMPAGSQIELSTNNGTIVSASSIIVPDTIGCRSTYPGCPATVGYPTFGDIPVTMKTDAKTDSSGGCTDSSGSAGILTVTVTSPKELKTTSTAVVTD